MKLFYLYVSETLRFALNDSEKILHYALFRSE